MEQPVVRLHLYFAAESDRAVIIRQGPKRQFRMILWHRDTDRFEDGQWLKKNLYTDRCAISPDGRHFLYFVLDGKWNSDAEGAYTVLCRPPFFTALSLFPEGSTWGGGGRFLDAVHYVADGDHDIIGRDDGLVRLMREQPTPDCPSGLRLPDGKCWRKGGLPVGEPTDKPLDRYDTMGGALYRRVSGGELELIRDFTDMTFEEILAPYDDSPRPASSTVGKTWHPLDGDKG